MDRSKPDKIEMSKPIAKLLDYVTCLECCRKYKPPKRAPCGHMLCHTCWHWRRTCPACKAPLDKKELQSDSMMQSLIKNICSLHNTFEECYSMNVDTSNMESTNPTKNYNNCQTSSRNHPSAQSSQSSTSQSVRETFVAGDLISSNVHSDITSLSLDKRNSECDVNISSTPIKIPHNNYTIDIATVDNNSNNKDDVAEDNRIEQSTDEVLKVADINDKNNSIDGSLDSNCNVKDASEKTNNEVSSVNNETSDCDDIFISIRNGNRMINITIKQNQNNVHVKEKIDQETQTSFVENILTKDAAVVPLTNTVHKGPSNNGNTQTSTINKEITKNDKIQQVQNILDKSVSTKKLTASADTATMQDDIIESVEDSYTILESGISEEAENVQPQKQAIGGRPDVDMCTTTQSTECLNDLDTFEYEFVKKKISSEEPQLQLLKNTEKAYSEIISVKSSKHKTLNIAKKRNRDTVVTNNELPQAKKQKTCNTRKDKEKEIEQDTEPDEIMGQVFANIDCNIEDIKQSQISNKNTNILKETSNTGYNSQKISDDVSSKTQCINKVQRNSSEMEANKYKYSENEFSILAKENECNDSVTDEKNTDKEVRETLVQMEINNMSTPNTPTDFIEEHADVPPADVDFGTPMQIDDSDKRAVEVTPQKTSSFAKSIPKKDAKSKTEKLNTNTGKLAETQDKSSNLSSEDTSSNLSSEDTSSNLSSEDKSSNLSSEDTSSNLSVRSKEKLYIASSCLSTASIARIKALCEARGWTNTDKYIKEVTHLVVGVDKENKSQRTLKYICALAASKWIVNYKWIDKCLQSKDIPNEEPYEALDSSGNPAPRLSRTAQRKIFEGMSFFCMPPSTRLDLEIIKEMLQAAGGTVMSSVEAVRVFDDSPGPALLLAEAERKQGRFKYMAIELNIVPVDYMWAIKCLCSYTLESIQEMLLCPSVLLPAATAQWPPCLLAKRS